MAGACPNCFAIAAGEDAEAWGSITGALQPGLDSPGKTHGDGSLVPAWPKAVQGVPWHFAA